MGDHLRARHALTTLLLSILAISATIPPLAAQEPRRPIGPVQNFARVGGAGQAATFKGLTPAKMKSVYGFPKGKRAGAGETIAIVIAFDAPTIENDLRIFSKKFDLPRCTTANGCFKKVNAVGDAEDLPESDPLWSLEAAIDVQWAHAIAPGAKILLVEADSAEFRDAFEDDVYDMVDAVKYAALNASYVSGSWGVDEQEFGTQAVIDDFDAELFSDQNVSFFFSTGDFGSEERRYPAISSETIGVGGTTLKFSRTGGFRKELGWLGSGGNCSELIDASPEQLGFGGYAQGSCDGKRAVPDLSLDADPASGARIYLGTPVGEVEGWQVAGGTSLAAPMVAARAAVTHDVVNQSYVYGNEIRFRDIKVGDNGEHECALGYDLVTGRGSWRG